MSRSLTGDDASFKSLERKALSGSEAIGPKDLLILAKCTDNKEVAARLLQRPDLLEVLASGAAINYQQTGQLRRDLISTQSKKDAFTAMRRLEGVANPNAVVEWMSSTVRKLFGKRT